MRGMPFFMENVAKHGVMLHNYYTNTPICCPSRATTLSGRYFHNQRMPNPIQGGCMHADIKGTDAYGLPSWNNFTVQRHFANAGWTTGPKSPSFVHLLMKVDDLPREARDKHQERGKTQEMFVLLPHALSCRDVWQAPPHERRADVYAGKQDHKWHAVDATGLG
jgi:hypothetical protein